MTRPDRSKGVPNPKKRRRHAENEHQSPSLAAAASEVPLSSSKSKQSRAKEDPAEVMSEREKQIYYLRCRLHIGFLSRERAPTKYHMARMAHYLQQLEAHVDLEPEIIKKTKIQKVLKAIIKLDSIPKEQESGLKQRCHDLLIKWGFPDAVNTTAVAAALPEVSRAETLQGGAPSAYPYRFSGTWTEEMEPLHKRKIKVSGLCSSLQDGFLSNGKALQEHEMICMSNTLEDLEWYRDLETEIIDSTQVDKTLEALVKLKWIPKDNAYYFRHRCNNLLLSWGKNPVIVYEAAEDLTHSEGDSPCAEEQYGPEGSRMPGDILTMADLNSKQQDHASDPNSNGLLEVFGSVGWQGKQHQQRTGVHPYNLPVEIMDHRIDATTRGQGVSQVAGNAERSASPHFLYESTPPKQFSDLRARLELARIDQGRAKIEFSEAVAQNGLVRKQLERAKQRQQQLIDRNAPDDEQQEAAREVDRLLEDVLMWVSKVEAARGRLAKVGEELKSLKEKYGKEEAEMENL